MLADRVALLQGGKITAVGRHSELLASSEHYRFVISSLEDEEQRVAARDERARERAAEDSAIRRMDIDSSREEATK
jgi:ATP-binding cassette subfamily B protein